jgi:hypothetical protein
VHAEGIAIIEKTLSSEQLKTAFKGSLLVCACLRTVD